MWSLWATLIPLAIACSLVPVQWTLTILLLRAAGGRGTAISFLLGLISGRLVQGALFGYVFTADSAVTTDEESDILVATLLLVVAVLLLVMGVRKLLADAPDDDAPPPKWMSMADTMGPLRAYLVGLGLMALGAKYWVFTIGAVAEIGAADLAKPAALATFLAFAVLTVAPSATIIGATIVAPSKAATALDWLSDWLGQNSRYLLGGLCLLFGAGFLLKSLNDLGVL